VVGLRTFSRLDEAELKTVDIRTGVDATLHLIRGSVPDGVEIDVDHGDLPTVTCYPGPLNQVFLNLLNNALQAVGDAGRIRVHTRREEDWAVFEVADDGPGIPADVLPRIFDPFFTTKDVGSGTGLGLSISHGIVERHGGHVDVRSDPAGGAIFAVRLPVGGPQDQAL